MSRWIVALSAATYAAFGVLGQGLHSVLPCGDACCETAAHDCCSCGHVHLASTDHPAAAEVVEWQAEKSGHDAANCSICALLAKINVGYALADSIDVLVETVRAFSASVAILLPADPVLLASVRGPPVS